MYSTCIVHVLYMYSTICSISTMVTYHGTLKNIPKSWPPMSHPMSQSTCSRSSYWGIHVTPPIMVGILWWFSNHQHPVICVCVHISCVCIYIYIHTYWTSMAQRFQPHLSRTVDVQELQVPGIEAEDVHLSPWSFSKAEPGMKLGKTLRKCWKIRGKCWKIRGKCWKIRGKSRKIRGKSRKIRGKSWKIPENQRKIPENGRIW